MRPPSADKIIFVLSLAALAFLYGIATHALGWFPSTHLERAWQQVRQEFGKPLYLTSRIYDRHGVHAAEPRSVQPGLTLISTFWGDFDWRPGLKLIDRDGETVHEWEIEPADLFADSGPSGLFDRKLKHRSVFGSILYPNGDVVVNIMYVGTARLDACGNVLWQIPAGSHHSVAVDDDGSFWVPGIGGETQSGSTSATRFGDSDISYPNYILHIAQDGAEVLDTIKMLDVLDDNGLRHLVPKYQLGVDSDITHLNDVKPLSSSLAEEYPLFEAGDLLVSLRDLHLIFVMDPRSREIKWQFSESLNRQHDPHFVGSGWIGVLDNNTDGTERGILLGGSRIIAVEPHTDSIEIRFPTERSDPFYTAGGGKWQELGNGNLLLTESQAGRIVEVAPDGRTVWEWISEAYDESLVPEITEGTRYDLSVDDVADWPCSPGRPMTNESEPTP